MMKPHLILLAGAAALALVLPARADVVTFDDLTDNGIGTTIPNGYAGLDWNNLADLNVADFPAAYNYYGPSGYPVVEQSGPNVAVNYGGRTSDITAPTGTFNLDSGYFAASYDTEAMTVRGYQGSTLVFDHTYDLSEYSATFITFDYTDITDAQFSLSPNRQITMDNLTVDLNPVPTPEPGQLLAGLAGAGLGGASLLVRRFRNGK